MTFGLVRHRACFAAAIGTTSMSSFEAHKYALCMMPDPRKNQRGEWVPCRHVSFVTVDSTKYPACYSCALCNFTAVEPLFELHCKEEEHVCRVQAICLMQENRIARQCVEVHFRADQLGLPAWRTEVFGQLYWCLLYQTSRDHDNNNKRMNAAKRVLFEFEHRERVSLLELAVWKAVCIAVKDNGCHHSWQEWFRDGWKSCKPRVRAANEIGIIVTSVLPFLGKVGYTET
jgi:hypothetical protein